MKRVKKSLPIIFFVLTCIFAFIGCFLIKYSHNINKEVSVNYTEKSDVDYKVYLKENSFFETPYLEKNKTYIASLIDYILIDYNYTFNVDKNVKGTYSYYIKGTVSANKNNSKDTYWSKDYILSEKQTKNYNNTKEINIKSQSKINYQVYNDLLNDFKSQYGVSMDGVLNVSLVIENIIQTDVVDRQIKKDSNIELNIPLTTLTVEVPIATNDVDNKGVLISDTVKQEVTYYTIMKYLGYLSIVISALFLTYLLYTIYLISKCENKYNKTLKKILKTYDNIIVNTNTLPNLDSLDVISVTSFDELIDAHGEVRKPINYILQSDCSTFILINDGMAWRYDLKKEPLRYRKKK